MASLRELERTAAGLEYPDAGADEELLSGDRVLLMGQRDQVDAAPCDPMDWTWTESGMRVQSEVRLKAKTTP